jgi:hypothetical protein
MYCFLIPDAAPSSFITLVFLVTILDLIYFLLIQRTQLFMMDDMDRVPSKKLLSFLSFFLKEYLLSAVYI